MNATVVSKSTVCSHVSKLAVTIHGGGVTVGRCLADSMIMTRGVGTLRCHKGVTSFPSCTTRARARKGTKCIETQAAIARFEETFVFVHSTLYTRPTLWALAKETTYLIGATPAMTEVGIITLNNVLIAVCSCPTWI